MTMETNPTEHKQNLKESIFSEIEEKNVEPKGKGWFLTREAAVWLLWSVSLALGAVTVAVLLYIAKYQQYAVYEVTHESGLSFMVSVLPYLWLSILIAASALSYYEMRHTKHGYKYPLWRVASGSLGLILVMGIAFEYLEVGGVIDQKLGTHMPSYHSQELKEVGVWQQPQQGRMMGVIATTSAFVDSEGHEWTVKTAELRPFEEDLLKSGREVKVFGTSTHEGEFVVCGVFPSARDKEIRSKMKEARIEFSEKVKEYREIKSVKEIQREIQQEIEEELAELVNLNEELIEERPCQHIPVLNR